jgi:hypothetical protein
MQPGMTVVRHAAAGIAVAAAVALGASAVVAFAVGGLFWFASLYLLGSLGLYAASRQMRPPRRRFVFARR